MVKKGSLNLSIQAIVIIVIAFVVLGLGLTFVRSQFKSMGETAGAVQEQISQQILEDLRVGDKKLSFPTEEVKVTKSDSKQLSVGVKNTEETDLKFTIQIKLIETDTTVDNKVDVKDIEDYEVGKFIWDTSTQSLAPTEANVFPIKFIAGKHAETYTFQILIMPEGATEAYATKSFFITIL